MRLYLCTIYFQPLERVLQTRKVQDAKQTHTFEAFIPDTLLLHISKQNTLSLKPPLRFDFGRKVKAQN